MSSLTHTDRLVAPRDGAAAGRLRFRRGARDLGLRAAWLGDDLLRGHFLGPRPELRVEGGDVALRQPPLWRSILAGRLGPSRLGLVLSRDLPWALAIGGGAAEVDADLRGLDLRSLTIGGGVRGLVLALPHPRGRVPIRIGGGAARVFVLRPHGVEARVHVGGGAARLAVDAFEAGAIGGSFEHETPGFTAAEDAFEIEIGGGAEDLTLREGAAPAAFAATYRAAASISPPLEPVAVRERAAPLV
jgi:hypothetical protein